MDIIDRILKVVEESQLTPIEFADKLGINKSAITHFMTGRNQPTLDVIQRIAQVFPHVSLDWLINGDKDESGNTETNKETAERKIEYKREEPPIQISAPQNRLPHILPQNTNQTRRAIKMVIYYSDNTFEMYQLHKEDY